MAQTNIALKKARPGRINVCLFSTEHCANKPTSIPSRWPGVRLLLSILASEDRDNSTRLRVLLAEACVAVFLSLLALAWSNNQPNQLYRLICNSLKGDMWGLVFGGGVKVVTRPLTGIPVKLLPAEAFRNLKLT